MKDIDWGALVELLFLLLIVLIMIRPSIRRSRITRARQRLIQQIEARRSSRVIVMIERPKIVSLFGIPLSRSLEIEDPATVLHSIRFTLSHVPIDLIVHTTGWVALAAGPLADALLRHNAPVTLMIPYYAMSGGTRLAFASDKILMGRSAVLGPEVCPPGSQPPLGILEALAEVLSAGCWRHPAPITFDIARELGMQVTDKLPDEAYQLVDLYPQAAYHPPSAQPVPMLSALNDAHIAESEKA
jgi:serine dehydrogenase proteinase